jgi:hypothetical protein
MKHIKWFSAKCLGKAVSKSKLGLQPEHPFKEFNRILNEGNVGKGIIYAIVYVGNEEIPPSKTRHLRYVGQTWQPMMDRWIQHVHQGENFNKSIHSDREINLYQALHTYGFTNFIMMPVQYMHDGKKEQKN